MLKMCSKYQCIDTMENEYRNSSKCLEFICIKKKIYIFDNIIKKFSPVGEQTGCGIHWLLMAQWPVLQGKFLHRTAGPGGETASPNEEVCSLVAASEDHLSKQNISSSVNVNNICIRRTEFNRK